ncbi:MAG: hypothetical protein GTO40_11650 [Deltaproteobacteria bacterium]|nr:hypothetical protein [Deltaproteobacteria bacterium]
MLITVPFRHVYTLRLILCLGIGCPIAAYLNRFGVEIWLIKHQGPTGPATVLDGVLIGAAVGMGIALLPSLTSLIKTNHPEMAKSFIIITYCAAAMAGGIIGAILAAVGRSHFQPDRVDSGRSGGVDPP